jgi:phosphomannomutase
MPKLHAEDVHGGIQITGSHNPANYNGFKMVFRAGRSSAPISRKLGPDGRRGRLGLDRRALTETSDDPGRVCRSRLVEGPRRLADVDTLRRCAIGWDAGNGAAGPALERLVKLLPGEHFTLFTEVDGNFPNHHPDPTDEANLADLKKLVAAKKLDFGVAFDGDGDRIGAIDGEGRVIWGDQLLDDLCRALLQRSQPGATIIADVKASQALYRPVAELGGKPADVEDRAQPDQIQNEGNRAARWRDERPRVLRARLLRLRRRALCRRSG